MDVVYGRRRIPCGQDELEKPDVEQYVLGLRFVVAMYMFGIAVPFYMSIFLGISLVVPTIRIILEYFAASVYPSNAEVAIVIFICVFGLSGDANDAGKGIHPPTAFQFLVLFACFAPNILSNIRVILSLLREFFHDQPPPRPQADAAALPA